MFFVNRIFKIFDSDGDGQVSLIEFFRAIQSFSSDDSDTKIEFLFKIFDIDGDGYLQDYDLRKGIVACMEENGMQFDESDVEKLTNALFHDGRQDGADHLTLDDFKNQLKRQEGLVENLNSMIKGLLIPPDATKGKSIDEMLAQDVPSDGTSILTFAASSKSLWINIIVIINLIILGERIFYFKDFYMTNSISTNPMYQLSRACGKALMFNSVLVLVLVLRKTITAMARHGLAKILPIEINIYLHKIVGIIIFFQSLLHSLMHVFNFWVNVQHDPVKFLQMTYHYWARLYGVGLAAGGYQFPPGCSLVNSSSPLAVHCQPNALIVPDGANLDMIYNRGEFLCQACPSPSRPWTYIEWMFTSQPGMFGSVGGVANPTGIALMLVITIIFICSLSFIRRTGHFEVFYYSHLLYWVYFLLLLLHAPDYFLWVGVFLLVWVWEQTIRLLSYLHGENKTVITDGVLLPSGVEFISII